MTDPKSATELSPLDQIRLAEADIARKIIAAREKSESAVVEVHSQAVLIKKQAHESGIRDGQIRYKETVFKAEEEARTIIEHAHSIAADLQRNGQVRMNSAIQEAMDIVLGLRRREQSNEP